ncbi:MULTISPECIES: hydroxymethylbilane synthase [Actinoalloteichus]|uniref:Porphobilinogen deaminase n=1 Tax=Actinoalloteichus caeruleus DSM 43889 TaxID=1120930 RepID=A0ABT1JF29_ACTCY|nr:hydroxymethylbilane synthase [Actinoalloteichus caeruleus]MCP2331107.1 hydroxymethylbilane synthase [Actinoalloteichus caeruleus DSM 43889]
MSVTPTAPSAAPIEELKDEVAARFADVPLRIGTRTSPLARAQTDQVIAAVRSVLPDLPVETVGIETSADRWHGNLAELGGKGAFTKEIDGALVAGEVDLAVHSMKDVPGDVPLPAGTELGAFLPRGDTHDVLISRTGVGLGELPEGARVGTSAVRRRSQLGLYRSDLRIDRIRGSVNARLAKLDAGEFDAIVLARVGLERIGLTDRITEVLSTVWSAGSRPSMVPACGAAVIGVQARVEDQAVMRLLAHLGDEETTRWVSAERTALHLLSGHCNSPIALHCTTTDEGRLALSGLVFSEDGSGWVRSHATGVADDPVGLGARVADDLISQGARELIGDTRH